MPSITFSDFSAGYDLRQSASMAGADHLRELTNAYITTGKSIRRRPGLSLVQAIEAGTVGLVAGGGALNTFYGSGSITHANGLFVANKIAYPATASEAVQEVFRGETFNGYLYLAALYENGETKHHYLNDPGARANSTSYRLGDYRRPAAANGYRYKVTAVDNGVTAWAAATAYSVGAFRRKVASNGYRYEVTAIAGTGTSGASEPTWPTTAGDTVIDNAGANQITWTCRDTFISAGAPPAFSTTYAATTLDGGIVWTTYTTAVDDAQCPHTKAFTKQASKIFAVDGDVVRYSDTDNPLLWTPVSGSGGNDAGFLPTGLRSPGATDALALGQYQDKLAVFMVDAMQTWVVDPDPTLMALDKVVPGVGCKYHRGTIQFSNDILFPSISGYRSITQSNISGNLNEVDVGSPIDALVRPILKSALEPSAIFSVGTGQILMFIPNTAAGTTDVHALTYSKTAKLSAWSVYTYAILITDVANLNGELYVRSGDYVYKFDDEVFLDGAASYETVIEFPLLNLKRPHRMKYIYGMDVMFTGSASIKFKYLDENQVERTTDAVTLSGDTSPMQMTPVEITSTAIAPIITTSASADFELSAITFHFDDLGP